MRFSGLARRETLLFFSAAAGAEGRALPGEEVVRHIRMGFNLAAIQCLQSPLTTTVR
jgi:hypothetical protein